MGPSPSTGSRVRAAPNVFTIKDTSVQFNAADALSGTTINFTGTGLTRYVDAQGTTNTFNIQGAGASGPSGSLVGGSGTNAFVFSGSAKLIGSIQGGGASTLNYAAYGSGVNVNLGNGTNGTATGVSGTVTGITAVIGSNSNDTLNAGTVPNVALTGGLGTNSLSGTGTGDSVVESIASSYTLTSTKLTGTGAALHRQSQRHHGRVTDRRQCHQQYLHRQRLDRDRVAVPPRRAPVPSRRARAPVSR